MLYIAPNCPRRIVAPNCPRRIVQRRIVRAELSAPNCPAPNCPGTAQMKPLQKMCQHTSLSLAESKLHLLFQCLKQWYRTKCPRSSNDPRALAQNHFHFLLSYHPIFLRPYHFLKLVSFLGANRTKSAFVCPWLLRGAI